VPDRAGADRNYGNFAIFWPAAGRTPATPSWQERNIQREWRRASLNRRTGIVSIELRAMGTSTTLVRCIVVHGRAPDCLTRRPRSRRDARAATPRGSAETSDRPSSQRTGFQKVAQLLGDALLREIAPPTQEQNRKLVVFSDSRQDAAKLSAGSGKRIIWTQSAKPLYSPSQFVGAALQPSSKSAQGQALTATGKRRQRPIFNPFQTKPPS